MTAKIESRFIRTLNTYENHRGLTTSMNTSQSGNPQLSIHFL